MNTLGVMLNDLMLASDIPNRSFLPFPVAPGAEVGDICREGNRSRIRLPQHAVGAVTLFARRPVRIVLCHQLTMNTLLVLLANFSMAGRTIHFLRDGLTRAKPAGIDLRVALTACHRRVAGLFHHTKIDRQ